jgi:hypothetical protein
MDFGKFMYKQCFVRILSHYSSNFFESKVIVQQVVFIYIRVFETIIRSTNAFQKNEHKKFCVSVGISKDF